MSENREEVEATIGGQHIKLNVSSLNTVATISVLIISCIIITLLGLHVLDSKADAVAIRAEAALIRLDTKAIAGEVVSAIKDLTYSQREANCINTFPENQRHANTELCKRMAK